MTVKDVPFRAIEPFGAMNLANWSGALNRNRWEAPSGSMAVITPTPSTCPDTRWPPSSSASSPRAGSRKPWTRRKPSSGDLSGRVLIQKETTTEPRWARRTDGFKSITPCPPYLRGLFAFVRNQDTTAVRPAFRPTAVDPTIRDSAGRFIGGPRPRSVQPFPGNAAR